MTELRSRLETEPAPERAAPPEPPLRRSVWSRPPLLWVRLGYLTLLNSAFSSAYRFVRSHYRLWHRLSAHSGPTLDRLARLHAYLMCAWAKKRVPAYAQFLSDNGHVFRLLDLSAFPETTKENYVRRYGFAARCRHGRIPGAGTIVDKSAVASSTSCAILISTSIRYATDERVVPMLVMKSTVLREVLLIWTP